MEIKKSTSPANFVIWGVWREFRPKDIKPARNLEASEERAAWAGGWVDKWQDHIGALISLRYKDYLSQKS